MIRVDFDPEKLPGSIRLRAEDLADARSLAVKLGDAEDPLAPFLRTTLPAPALQKLRAYDAATPLPTDLRDDILSWLNDALPNPTLYDRKRFKDVEWRKERQTLLPELIKIEPTGEGLECLNRLLLEEVYRSEIAASLKAEWLGWRLLGEAAKQNVIQQWEDYKAALAAWKLNGRQGDAPAFDPKLKENLWRGFRDWMKRNVFHNKCAYCESKLTAYPGDTEHFRPKGRVSVRRADGKLEVVKVVDEDGDEIPHPGYFWLAYHWQNLLPSCEFCNTAGGKKDIFPVRAGNVAVRKVQGKEFDDLIEKITQSRKSSDVYYLEPKDLDRIEQRLLLHPTLDEPEQHIYFDMAGEAHEWCGSEEGKKSIEVFDLNEQTKLEARLEEQEEARGRYANKVIAGSNKIEDLRRLAEDFFAEYYQGSKPYAAAVFDYIDEDLEPTRYAPARLLGRERRKKC